MISIYKRWEHLALSIALAGGLTAFAGLAEANGNSTATVRSAQQQLKNDGYYTGAVDGIDGSMTHAAIRKYQNDNNLTENGRLDQATCNKLGLQNTGEANRTADMGSMNGNSANQEAGSNYNMSYSMSRRNIESAQRQLQQKGFYNGAIDGEVGPETTAAIRQFQRNNGLNVTGRFNQNTLHSLGVSSSK